MSMRTRQRHRDRSRTSLVREGQEHLERLNVPREKAEPRTNGAAHAAPAPEVVQKDVRPTLAVFCYEGPDSLVGRYLTRTATALAARDVAVHLFTPHAYDVPAAAVTVHAVGTSAEGDLLDQVQEFTRRASEAFLRQFPNGSARVTLMGHEWSSVPVLSVLRDAPNAGTLLSLHSLERQRSDMGSELSRRIEEIEFSGLREAGKVLIHQPATAEVARHWVPGSVDRVVHARTVFPTQDFAHDIDPGQIKARYQVGPVDPTILFVGDLDERYGPDLLVKSMPAVLKNHRQARLVIVGDGSLYWPLRVYTRYLLLEHAVRLAGSVEGQAMQELVQAADVICVPSRESTPWWPVLAGWAAQRPVVASHQAAPGLVEHEKDSVLVYPSESSVVWGIERVLFDAELGRTIGRQGHEKLEQRFGWNSVAEQLEELMGVPAARK